MKLSPDDAGHGEIAFTGFYELALTRCIAEHARAGGLLVDVGANYGYFTMLWLAGGAANRALSFEAAPGNIATLRENAVRNHCADRVEIRATAVGREIGSARFDVGAQSGWGGLAPATSDTELVVPMTTLDEAVPKDAVIDVLKIDVEGADTWVLQGAEKILRERRVRQIYYEQNHPRMQALGILENEAADFLRSVRYETSILGEGGFEIVEWKAQPAS